VRLGERLVVWGCGLQTRYAHALGVSGALQTEPVVMAPYPQSTTQGPALSPEELAKLREAIPTMQYVHDLLSKYPELAGGEEA
jgi:hypothetical protein